MRTHRTALAALAILSAGVAQAGNGMPWAKSFEDATASAAKAHKLVMVDFYTDW